MTVFSIKIYIIYLDVCTIKAVLWLAILTLQIMDPFQMMTNSLSLIWLVACMPIVKFRPISTFSAANLALNHRRRDDQHNVELRTINTPTSYWYISVLSHTSRPPENRAFHNLRKIRHHNSLAKRRNVKSGEWGLANGTSMRPKQ